jgi:hypothetical protein
VAERGLLQYRADSETVKDVLRAAEARKMPVGAMIREWVKERLLVENGKQKSPDLGQRVAVLEKTVAALQKKLR